MLKKKCVKIGIIAIVIGLTFFSGYSFAEGGTEPEKIEGLAYLLNFAVSILSWIWILFADLAGKFLTNNWVYGEVIGLDSLLWQYRVMVRNFANFGLGFYFVYVIFRALINRDDIMKKIKGILLWILVGGVGIQASRFLTAAIIDVSTITLVAAGSLPAQLIAKDNKVQQAYEKNLSAYISDSYTDAYYTDVHNYYLSGKLLNLFPKNGESSDFIATYPITIEGNLSKEQVFDKLMPNSETISGPLEYLGFAILRVNVIPTVKSSDNKGLKDTIFNTILQGGTSIVYSIEMLVLLVLAIIRVVYLRIFIILSPLVVLLWSIDKSKNGAGKGKDGFLKSITTHINFKSFFINVFKPTIIVLGIGLTVIFVSLMSSVIIDNQDKEVDINGVKMVSQKNNTRNITGNPTYTTTVDTNLLRFTLVHASQTLLGLFMSIITVILMYMIIKIAVNMGGGNDFVSKGIKNVQDMTDKLVSSVPVVPVPGYDDLGYDKNHYISARGVPKLFDRVIVDKKNEYDRMVSEQSDSLSRALGFQDDKNLTSEELTSIKQAGVTQTGISQLEAKKNVIEGLRTEEGKNLSLKNKEWSGMFESWLNNLPKDLTDHDWKGENSGNSWNGIKGVWDGLEGEKKTLKNLFDHDKGKYAKAYAEYFGYQGTAQSASGFTSIETLDITKKPK